MRPLGFRRIGLAGAAAVTLFVAPSAKASQITPSDLPGGVHSEGAGTNGGSGGTTVTVDLGTVAYGVNVNASILNSSHIETYTYEQLLFGGTDLSTVLDSGLTIGEALAQDLGEMNPGTLTYDFLFGGASGFYAQNGSPPFPPTSEFPGTVSVTATSVSGHACPGANSVGATINIDPINAAETYSAVLGCEPFTNLNNGFPTSTATTVTLTLGTITSTGTGNTVSVTVVNGEDTTTTWTSSGQLNAGAASVPEPWSVALVATGIVGLLTFRAARRRRLGGPRLRC